MNRTEVKKCKVETLSDLDEATFKIMGKCRDDEMFMDYKEIAFQNGVIVDVLLKVFAIYMRDELKDEVLDKSSEQAK